MRIRKYVIIPLLALILYSCGLFKNDSGIPINENIWVNGFLASWQHNPETALINSGDIKTSDIDWDAMTHMTYFALSIGADGRPNQTLDPQARANFNSDRLNAIVPAAHAHNTKILFSVGGGGNYEGFSSAIVDTNRAQFINTITSIISTYGFDGVNLNMVPIEPTDYNNYGSFVRLLSAVFDTMKTNNNERPLLTVAALKSDSLSSLYAELQDHFDQINILTYDMAQPWRGWQAWHNSALYNRNAVFDDNPSLKFPSVDDKVNEAIAAGIKREKIGIGINFYGYIWHTVNLLGKWAIWPTQDMSILEGHSYAELADSLDLSNPEWDNNAKVPYINEQDPKAFVTFENEESVREKINYAKTKRIGGVMLWELGAGFIPDQTVGPKDPLLQAVKEEAFKNRQN